MTAHEIAQRLRGYIGDTAQQYPGAWNQIAAFREQRRELGDWPQWCYCPIAGAYAVVSRGSDRQLSWAEGLHVSKVAALAAWRATQGIYLYDATLLDALWSTSVDGELPVDVITKLPEWCIYIPTLVRTIGHLEIVGYFAHLEHDMNEGRMELRLLLDCVSPDPILLPIPLHIWRDGGFPAAIRGAMEEAEFQSRVRNAYTPETRAGLGAIERVAQGCEPLVSVLLYLCAENAEIADPKERDRAPGNDRLRRVRGREVPAEGVAWQVGYRMGQALRDATARADGGDSGGRGSVSPHVRRAHWHHYRTGKGRVNTEIRWLSPILVGGVDAPDLPTVRKVRR